MGGATDGVSFNHDWIDDDVLRLVRRKVRQMRRMPALVHMDDEDVQQDLMVRLLQKSHLLDIKRGHPIAFATVALESAAASLCRHVRARKRSGVAPVSLCEKSAVPRAAQGSHEDAVDLAHDLSVIVSLLPDDMREGWACALRDAESACSRSRFTDRPMRRRLARRRPLLEKHDVRP